MMEDTQFQAGANRNPIAPSVPRHALPIALLVGGILVVTARLTTPAMTIAMLAWFLMLGGFLSRKTDPARHGTLMAVAMGLDLSLVLVLQVQRSAIQTAVAFTLTPLQQAHIGASTLATLLYFPLAWLGWTQWKERRSGSRTAASPTRRALHMRLGIAAFVLRTAGLFLMFSMLSHVRGSN